MLTDRQSGRNGGRQRRNNSRCVLPWPRLLKIRSQCIPNFFREGKASFSMCLARSNQNARAQPVDILDPKPNHLTGQQSEPRDPICISDYQGRRGQPP